MKSWEQKRWISAAIVMLMLAAVVVCLTNVRAQGNRKENRVVVAKTTIHGFELRLVCLSDKKNLKTTELGVYEGKYVLETTKDDTVYGELILQFPEKDTLAFPAEGFKFVVKDYDGDGSEDDFSLGQGQQPTSELGSYMEYKFFTVDEDGSIVQLALSTDNGESILTKPGEYSGDFEQKDNEIYYTGFDEDGEEEMMAASIVRLDSVTDSQTDTEKIYRNFLKEVKAENLYKNDEGEADEIYTATMKSGYGEELLLITDGIISDRTSAHANVYQCVGGKVVFIGYISSTGSGYPLCQDGQYLLAGYHHSSTKLKVDYGTGTIYEVEGFGLGKEMCTLNKYTIKNGRQDKFFSRTITVERANEIEYYYDSQNDTMKGTPIIFKKFK